MPLLHLELLAVRAESTTPRCASHVHKRHQTDINQLALKANGHGSHVHLTAPPRYEPPAARNVKWYTWICWKRWMTVFRLHGFGALVPFPKDQHLTVLHAVIHGGSDDTVSSSMNSETNHREVLSGRFRLCRAIRTVLGTLRKVLHAVLREFKSSLHSGLGCASPAALIQHIMCLRGADDGLCAVGRCANINPCVTVPSQTPHATQEHPSDRLFLLTSRHHRRRSLRRALVQLRVGNGLGSELPFLR